MVERADHTREDSRVSRSSAAWQERRTSEAERERRRINAARFRERQQERERTQPGAPAEPLPILGVMQRWPK